MRHPEESVSAYLDGELHGAELRDLLRHLARCGRCSADLEQIQRVRAAVRSLPVMEVPDGLIPGLATNVVPLREKRSVWVGAAAAAVAIAITVATLFSPEPQAISVEDLNSRFGARVSLDPAFGPAKVIVPPVGEVLE